MSYVPHGEGVFVWPTVLTLAMEADWKSGLPIGRSGGKTFPQEDPACDGHQVGAGLSGEPGVFRLPTGSFGL